MPLVVPTNAERDMLADVLGPDHTLRLYTNDRTPAKGDLASSYVEASGRGYAPHLLTADGWEIQAGAPSVATHETRTFVFDGVLGDVYGYFVTRNSDGALRWAERFNGAPLAIVNDGDKIDIQLSFSLGNA